jgi:hypothetical protein
MGFDAGQTGFHQCHWRQHACFYLARGFSDGWDVAIYIHRHDPFGGLGEKTGSMRTAQLRPGFRVLAASPINDE